MKTVETTIEGVRCELELWVEDEEPRSSLFLHKTDPADGARFSGSLHLCAHLGGVPWDEHGDPGGKELWPVSDRTFGKVYDWAVQHGY